MSSSPARRLPILVALALVLSSTATPPPSASAPRAPRLVRVTGASPFPDACGVDNSFFGDGFEHAETEPSLAVNPRNPRNLVAAWMQDHSLTYVVASSRDGGRTWRRTLVPGISRCDGGDARAAADPWLSFGGDGTLYLSGFSVWLDPPGPPLPTRFRLQVSTSRDGGRSWSPPREVLGGAVMFHDKPTITGDPRRAGVAYLVWHESAAVFAPPGPLIFMSRTSDGGETWSPPTPVPMPHEPGFAAGAETVVLPDGTLVVVATLVRAAPFDHTIVAVRSEDGGTTWSAPSVVTSHPASPFPSSSGDCRSAFSPYRPAGSDRCIFAPETLATIDVAPDGTLYVAARRGTPGEPGTVDVMRSRDGGRTWGAPVTVSTPGVEAFVPNVAAGPKRGVAVTYYDLSGDRPTGSAITGGLWVARSRDGGRTWTRSRIRTGLDWATAPYRRIPAEGLWLADYTGLVTVPGGYAAVFPLTRSFAARGNSDIFFTRLAA